MNTFEKISVCVMSVVLISIVYLACSFVNDCDGTVVRGLFWLECVK